jgi:ATP-dependent Clp protease ATP-binding subunit ClpC
MFERFTDRARRVVVLAQEEARMLEHNYVGTEHLLLGLVHDGDGVAARALESLGISLEAVRQQVEEIIGRGQHPLSGSIPFTPRAKKTMELALREAEAMGHGYVGTEHLLLGLVREGDGVAAKVIVRLGGDLNRVRQQVILLQSGGPGSGPVSAHTRRGKQERERLIDEALSRVNPVDQRLAAIERWTGMTPDLGDLDQEIARVRREQESAIDSQDFEAAAVLRVKERELVDRRLSRESEWAAAADRRSLAAELSRVTAELKRLQDILRQHGLDGAA